MNPYIIDTNLTDYEQVDVSFDTIVAGLQKKVAVVNTKLCDLRDYKADRVNEEMRKLLRYFGYPEDEVFPVEKRSMCVTVQLPIGKFSVSYMRNKYYLLLGTEWIRNEFTIKRRLKL